MTNDAGMCSIFVLLDLNAAFNTINHRIFIRQTEEMVGYIRYCTELDPIFQTEISVSINTHMSSFATVKYGFLKFLILGSILFCLYTLLGNDVYRHGVFFTVTLTTYSCMSRLSPLTSVCFL